LGLHHHLGRKPEGRDQLEHLALLGSPQAPKVVEDRSLPMGRELLGQVQKVVLHGLNPASKQRRLARAIGTLQPDPIPLCDPKLAFYRLAVHRDPGRRPPKQRGPT